MARSELEVAAVAIAAKAMRMAERNAKAAGSVGTRGEKGERGPQGLSGERGPQGLGVRGDKGVQGVRGERGPQGLGVRGDKGVQGVRGEKGDKGDDGKEGVGIEDVYIDARGDQIVVYTNGKKKKAGRARGRDGASGDSRLFAFGVGGGVTNNGGVTEARVLELIEANMPTPDIEYPRIVTTVTTTGDNTLLTPAAGKALRVRRIKCTADPDSADTPMLTLRVGAKLIQRGPVLYGADFIEGAADAPLVLNLESAAKIGVTILYEEFTP